VGKQGGTSYPSVVGYLTTCYNQKGGIKGTVSREIENLVTLSFKDLRG
jgi:hypothetical protein